MFESLAKSGREFEEITREHVNEYADAGLRTLILAYREITNDEYQTFNEQFLEAKNSVSVDRDVLIDEATKNIEKELILLGATAVEDKLQQGVSLIKSPVSYHHSNVVYDFVSVIHCVRFLNALTNLHKQVLRYGF